MVKRDTVPMDPTKVDRPPREYGTKELLGALTLITTVGGMAIWVMSVGEKAIGKHESHGVHHGVAQVVSAGVSSHTRDRLAHPDLATKEQIKAIAAEISRISKTVSDIKDAQRAQWRTIRRRTNGHRNGRAP